MIITLSNGYGTRSGLPVTNGADWYIAEGTCQDWCYDQRGEVATTIEVSTTKNPRRVGHRRHREREPAGHALPGPQVGEGHHGGRDRRRDGRSALRDHQHPADREGRVHRPGRRGLPPHGPVGHLHRHGDRRGLRADDRVQRDREPRHVRGRQLRARAAAARVHRRLRVRQRDEPARGRRDAHGHRRLLDGVRRGDRLLRDQLHSRSGRTTSGCRSRGTRPPRARTSRCSRGRRRPRASCSRARSSTTTSSPGLSRVDRRVGAHDEPVAQPHALHDRQPERQLREQRLHDDHARRAP